MSSLALKSSPFSPVAAIATGAVALVSITCLVAAHKYRTNANNESVGNEMQSQEDVAELAPFQQMLVQGQDKGTDQVVCAVVLGGKTPTKANLEATVHRLQTCADATLAAGVVWDSQHGQIRLRKTDETAVASGQVSIVEDGDWEVVMETSLNTIQFRKPTAERPITPTWRVILVVPPPSSSPAALLFVLNHVAFDGTARNRLIRAFFQAYAEVVQGSSKTNDSAEGAQQPAPVFCGKDLAKQVKYKSWVSFLGWEVPGIIYREFATRNTHFCPPLAKLSPGILNPDSTTQTSRQVRFVLTPKETSALVGQARTRGTTVHGAVSAAMTLALVATFRDKGYELPSATLRLGHLILLWGHVPPTAMPSTAIAGLMLSLKSVYTAGVILDKTDPWDLARRIKANLQGFVPPSVPQMILGFMLPKRIRAKIESTTVPAEYAKLKTSAALSIFNNGLQKYADQDYAGTRIEQVYAASARHGSPGDFGTVNLQTVRGAVCIGLCYYTHIWDDATAQAFVGHLQRVLGEMITC